MLCIKVTFLTFSRLQMIAHVHLQLDLLEAQLMQLALLEEAEIQALGAINAVYG